MGSEGEPHMAQAVRKSFERQLLMARRGVRIAAIRPGPVTRYLPCFLDVPTVECKLNQLNPAQDDHLGQPDVWGAFNSDDFRHIMAMA
jgi:hypothetical protein